VAAILDAMAFITVPLSSPDRRSGRLYITIGTRGTFDQDDVEFLLLVFDHMIPMRHRIALDFHDRVIQPYIGLEMALQAIRQKLDMSYADVAHDIDRLLDLT
jgi:hypothetical protein